MFSSTLTHIALHVTQIGASVDFYRRYCNMHIIHQRNEGEIVWLAEPGREKEFIFVLMAGGKKNSTRNRITLIWALLFNPNPMWTG